LDTYLRKRAEDNLAKGLSPEIDVIHHDPQQRVEMRFTDAQIQPQFVQTTQQSHGIPPIKAKGKKPKPEASGEQEMGVIK
jgi:hypothetical protein